MCCKYFTTGCFCQITGTDLVRYIKTYSMHYFLLTIFCMDIFLGTLVDFRAINLLGKFSYVWNLEKLAKKRLKKKWYFVTKIVLTYCEKTCSSDQENF